MNDDQYIDEAEEQEQAKVLKHPSPEQVLMREAVKYLTPIQRKVWTLYNLDARGPSDIAEILDISQSAVSQHIDACEKKIDKWVKSNMAAYNLIKNECGDQDD